VHVERTARFHLPVPPERALPFFTPEGERDYVEGWDPEPLHAPSGSLAAAGAVFRTAAGGEETFWLALGLDPAAGTAAYVRITPGNRLGTVHVRCRAAGADRTEVEVTYRLTALAPAGESVLARMTEAAFAETIDGWRRDIEALLARNA
jgi:hypothetical protein